jgi:predicted regulator of Ras-like GTPase activity (Roadblock/LC7/MglB family)
MTDPIRELTAQLASDPQSLVFLELGEALRGRGQPAAAYKVARMGVNRYPELAASHDLLARVLADQGDRHAAAEAWRRVLELSPGHIGANKGLAFLAFRAGDPEGALPFLESALGAAPGDEGLAIAVQRVRTALDSAATRAASAAAAAQTSAQAAATGVLRGVEGFEPFEDARGVVLLDAQGLRLAGTLEAPDGTDVSDALAAHLQGVSREASRAARLLDLGAWETVTAESADGHLLVLPPTQSTVLVLLRDARVPVGRLGLIAEQAARAARNWLERLA